MPALLARPRPGRNEPLAGSPVRQPREVVYALRAPLARTARAPHSLFALDSATPVGMAGQHRLMWLAALANGPVAYNSFVAPGGAAPYPVSPPPRGGVRRWSADGWMLWRRGSSQSVAAGLFAPSYGASQAGAVLRYRLAPESAHRPSIFLRTTAALNGTNEREAALGLQARPFGRVPVVLAGEARFTSTPGGNMVRPAVFAVTELPSFALPLGFRGEAYAQGGYVGGKFATAFVDGQLRIDRRLVRIGAAEMRAGGGVWGGAQKGAARLDAGPSLVLGAPLGETAAVRLAADWRFRVSGNAKPASGPAVTLSAGF